MPIPLDMFVYTADELHDQAAAGNPFVRRMLAEGKLLHVRPGFKLPEPTA